MTFDPRQYMTDIRVLNPTFGTFDGEPAQPVDVGTARWYKGADEGDRHSGQYDNFIDLNVRAILRDYYEEGAKSFTPGPIGAYVKRKVRVNTEVEIADYHRKQREGNRREMLALRSLNDSTMEDILGSR